MEYLERVIKVEESTKSAHHRIDGLEAQNRAIIELTVSVGRIADKTDTIDCKVDKMVAARDTDVARISLLERAPGDELVAFKKTANEVLLRNAVSMLFGAGMAAIALMAGK